MNTLLAMDAKHLGALLEVACARKEGDWSILPEERTITLHAAFSGVGLNIGKVERLRVDGDVLVAQNSRGETFIVALSDVFAGAIDAEKKVARKAGFA